jgi:2-keto-3-deoxy-L-fuconate dehydrogenase
MSSLPFVALPGSDFGLNGATAVVTGGASGIGRESAIQLRDLGANVHVLDLDPSTAPEGTIGHVCDVSDTASVQAAVAQVMSASGGVIDVLLASAAIGAFGDAAANDEQEWQRVLDINVIGVVRVFQACLPGLQASSQASVILLGSIAGSAGIQRRAVYSATKGAIHALGLSMAADFLKDGIRVNIIAPATVNTPWIERMLAATNDPAAERASMEARQAHGRLVEAPEIAWQVAYLASPRSASVTGTITPVDAGMHSLRIY